MWFVLAVAAAVVVCVVRLSLTGRRTPESTDADRQHEVPGSHGTPPPRPPGVPRPSS